MNDLKFAQPIYLWFAFAAPVILAIAALHFYRRRAVLRRFAEEKSLERLAGSVSPLRHFLRALAMTFAVFFLLVAAAQPKYGMKPVPVQRKGVDLVIALDVSKSMDTADVPPSRLQRARKSIETLLNKLSGDRIGLVAFAGEAILIHPLTTRAAGFLITLETLDTDAVPTPGTALGAAIEEARETFEERSVKHRVLVIITDGETHDENAIEQATLAHEEGILIYTLGIGTPEGAPVPEFESGNRVEYKKRDGRYVISQLNTKLLQEIAETGGGAFYHFTGSSDALNRLYDRISHMGEIEDEESDRITELMNDIYQIPLTAAMVAMIAGLTIGQRRRSNQI